MQDSNSHSYGRGNDLRHYMLVVNPSRQISDRLADSLNDGQHDAESCVASLSPYVAITEFLARPEMEETIIRWLQRITSGQHSFTVTLNNYSGYPGKGVYIRIQDCQPFQTLAAGLQPIDDYIRSNSCPPVNFITQPNLPLLDDLGGKLSACLIGSFAGKEFHDSFEVNELMLVCTEEPGATPVRCAVLKLQPALAEHNKN